MPRTGRQPSCLQSENLTERVVVLKTITEVNEKRKEDSERLSKEMKECEQRLSARIEKVSAEMKEGEQRLSARIEEDEQRLSARIVCPDRGSEGRLQGVSTKLDVVTNRLFPLYLFVAVFATASGMANVKNFADLLK